MSTTDILLLILVLEGLGGLIVKIYQVFYKDQKQAV